jgi:hypothetical protein
LPAPSLTCSLSCIPKTSIRSSASCESVSEILGHAHPSDAR